jgi:hypothetical protein
LPLKSNSQTKQVKEPDGVFTWREIFPFEDYSDKNEFDSNYRALLLIEIIYDEPIAREYQIHLFASENRMK